MDFSDFQQARLIPVSGLKGDEEQERRTTSAFLAVLTSVPEFARTLLKDLDAPAGNVECYIEPEFELDERRIRPDGLIVVKRGKTIWTALVEVKTNKNNLNSDQLNSYLELCRLYEVDALLTISNQVLTYTGEHPTLGIDHKKYKKINLVHHSWIRILTAAIVQKEFRGISDPDQAWILGELIRFLQHPASGASEFNDMGDSWVTVREGILNATLTSQSKHVPETIHNFESLMRFAAFRLSAKLGEQVREVAPKLAKTDPERFTQQSITSFLETGCLTGEIEIPKTISNIDVTVDLRAGQIRVTISVPAPQDGRSLTRVNWLLRQLSKAPDNLRLETRVKNAGKRPLNVELLSDARKKPELLVPADGRDISGFTLTYIQKVGTKRGRGKGSFIDSVIDTIEDFYNSVLENLTPWVAKPSKPAVLQAGPDESPFDPEGPDSQPLGSRFASGAAHSGEVSLDLPASSVDEDSSTEN